MTDLKKLAHLALGKLHLLTREEQELLLMEIEKAEKEEVRQKRQSSFLPFVRLS